jgi:hypothetical protein
MTSGIQKANTRHSAITAKIANSCRIAKASNTNDVISPQSSASIALRVPTWSANLPPARLPITVAPPNSSNATLTVSLGTS